MSTAPGFLRKDYLRFVYKPSDTFTLNDSEQGDSLSELCLTHPKITLELRCPDFTSRKASRLLGSSLILRHTSGRRIRFFEKVVDDALRHKMLQSLALESARRMGSNEPLLPHNLMMFPYEDKLDREACRDSCNKNSFIRSQLIPGLKSGVDDLIAHVEECYATGMI